MRTGRVCGEPGKANGGGRTRAVLPGRKRRNGAPICHQTFRPVPRRRKIASPPRMKTVPA